MKHILNISLPKSWRELTDTQLRYVFRLFSKDYSLSQIKALCLLKWGGLQVVSRHGGVYLVRHNGKVFPLTSLQVTEASASLAWLADIPSYPVRPSRIGFHRAVRADLQDISFEDYLCLDNLYQGYLQTERKALLWDMAKILYRYKYIRLNPIEEISIFYWFTSVKKMFASMFKHFFKSVEGSKASVPSMQQLQDSMNTQIRALTGGDITKESLVLSMDCWRALIELDAKARDYEELGLNGNRKTLR